MGMIRRMRDVVASNVNAMLDKAENPDKLLHQLIREIEDALIQIKAQCASTMAQIKTCGRMIASARDRAGEWARKARVAVEKGREDLAREALIEKRSLHARAESLERQQTDLDQAVERYQRDITELESRLRDVLERRRILIQRHCGAAVRKRAQMSIRRMDASDVLARLEGFERRTERLEVEADLVNFGGESSLETRIDRLVEDDELEKELEAIRRDVRTAG